MDLELKTPSSRSTAGSPLGTLARTRRGLFSQPPVRSFSLSI